MSKYYKTPLDKSEFLSRGFELQNREEDLNYARGQSALSNRIDRCRVDGNEITVWFVPGAYTGDQFISAKKFCVQYIENAEKNIRVRRRIGTFADFVYFGFLLLWILGFAGALGSFLFGGFGTEAVYGMVSACFFIVPWAFYGIYKWKKTGVNLRSN